MVYATLRNPILPLQGGFVTDTISFSEQQGIATLCFNNPSRRNALGASELDAIEHALGSLSAGTRVLVVTSSDDRIFCAGADLSQILDGTLNGDRFQSVTNQIAALPIPTIAVLTGHVFGGGAELALSCDFRLAREGIVLRIPAAAIGLCYPVEGIERMTQRLGSTLVRRLLLTTEPVSFETLSQHGAIDWLVHAESVDAKSATLIEKLARLAPMSLAAMLRIIKMVETNTFDKAAAQALANECSASEDLQEGLRAQREKRAPVFNRR